MEMNIPKPTPATSSTVLRMEFRESSSSVPLCSLCFVQFQTQFLPFSTLQWAKSNILSFLKHTLKPWQTWLTPSGTDFPVNSPSSTGHFHRPSQIQQGRPTQTVPYHIQHPMALFRSTVSSFICLCSQVLQASDSTELCTAFRT